MDTDVKNRIETEEFTKKNCPRLCAKQLDIMLSYMEANKDLREGKLSQSFTKTVRKRKWNELAEILNAEGTAVKTPNKWMKCWQDQKSYAKNKAAKIMSRSQTSNGQVSEVLTPMEERILNLIGYIFTPPQKESMEELNTSDYLPTLGNCKLEDTLVTEESIYPIKSEMLLDDSITIEETVASEDSQQAESPPRSYLPEKGNSREKEIPSKKSGTILENLEYQNRLLERIAEANEQLVHACMLIAKNTEEQRKEASLQTALIQDINRTLRYISKQKSNEAFF